MMFFLFLFFLFVFLFSLNVVDPEFISRDYSDYHGPILASCLRPLPGL